MSTYGTAISTPAPTYGPAVSTLYQTTLPRGCLELDMAELVVKALPRVGWRLRVRWLWFLARGRMLDLDISDIATAAHTIGHRTRITEEPCP